MPVYNADAFLHRSIDSVLAQSFLDFELLLIDDGSTDKSGSICDEYQREDGRVRVFHQHNGGVNSARQLGINQAKGEFSIHVDSDDWIECNMLTEMYEKAISDGADFVIADFFRDTVYEKDVYDHQEVPSLSSADVLQQILSYSIYGCLWNKLIRTKLFRKYDVRFVAGIDYGEDVLLLSQLLLHPLKISKLNKAYYHYTNDNAVSLTRKYDISTYDTRKGYVDALMKVLPPRLYRSARKVSFNIVCEAFNNGVVRLNDLRNFYPLPFLDLARMKTSKSVKLAFFCASFYLDTLVRYLARRYNRRANIVDIV